MEDYIDILIGALGEQGEDGPGRKYLVTEGRLVQAAEALEEALDEEQKELFSVYEERRNELAFISENHLARQAFLLAKEIYR